MNERVEYPHASPGRARARHEVKAERPRCGAKTRAGAPCLAPAVPGKRRCRMHGGLSTGPRTPEGKARSLAAARAALARRGMLTTTAEGETRWLNGAEFFDLEGVPVSIGAGNGSPFCATWDTDPPLAFDPVVARCTGIPLSSTAFEQLVAKLRAES